MPEPCRSNAVAWLGCCTGAPRGLLGGRSGRILRRTGRSSGTFRRLAMSAGGTIAATGEIWPPNNQRGSLTIGTRGRSPHRGCPHEAADPDRRSRKAPATHGTPSTYAPSVGESVGTGASCWLRARGGVGRGGVWASVFRGLGQGSMSIGAVACTATDTAWRPWVRAGAATDGTACPWRTAPTERAGPIGGPPDRA